MRIFVLHGLLCGESKRSREDKKVKTRTRRTVCVSFLTSTYKVSVQGTGRCASRTSMGNKRVINGTSP